MGTRGLIRFYSKKVTKATYNHFDSYPKELGNNVKEYITSFTSEQMRDDFNSITLVNEYNDLTPADLIRVKNFSYHDVGKFEEIEDWYWLLHDYQGDLAGYAKIGYMIDSSSFIKDGLFCEWAYIINLDRGVLEIYRGFQTKKPKKNRYAMTKEEVAEVRAKKGYYVTDLNGKKTFHKNQWYNCDLIAQIPLEDVPAFDMDMFQDTVYAAEDKAGKHIGAMLAEDDLIPGGNRKDLILTVLEMTGRIVVEHDEQEPEESEFDYRYRNYLINLAEDEARREKAGNPYFRAYSKQLYPASA